MCVNKKIFRLSRLVVELYITNTIIFSAAITLDVHFTDYAYLYKVICDQALNHN